MHFIWRIRQPRHERLFGIPLLILNPVAYESPMLLPWGKASNLRQRIELFLAVRLFGSMARDYELGGQTIRESVLLDEARLRETLANLADS